MQYSISKSITYCITTFLFTLLLSPFLLSQTPRISVGTGIITGVVLDSLSNQPIVYANFVLFRLKDSTVFNGSSTDSAGRFVISNIPKDDYYAIISYIGYKPRKRNSMAIISDNQVIDLDTIKLSHRVLSTGLVQVTAEKEKIKYEDEKIIINVDRSLGNNAVEVLENTPMVSVDIDGKVSLMGRSGTAVYIDGVPAKYLGIEKDDDLKFLSSNDIEKIEIILDPSFKYTENSGEGVINIITKKKPSTKYSGSTTIDGSTKNHITSYLGLTFRHKDIFTRGSYANDISKSNASSSLLKTVTLDDRINSIEQSSDTKNEVSVNYITFSMGYNPDIYNSINTGLSFNKRISENSRLLTNQMTATENYFSDNFVVDKLTNMNQYFVTYFAMYNKRFNEKGRNFSAMFSHNKNSMDMDNSIDKRFISDAKLSLKQYNNSENSNNAIKWQLSYVHPFNENTRLETGYNGLAKYLLMNNTYFNFTENNQTSNTKYDDVKQNAYGVFAAKVWDINFDAGLSIQKYQIDYQELISANSFTKYYFTFIPSAGLNITMFGDHVIHLGYIRGSSLPENRQLNPHIDHTDSTNIFMGNPNLEPSFFSSIDLGYRIANRWIIIKAGIDYTYKNNIVEQITTQQTLQTAITTYKNLASSNILSADLYANKTLFNWLQLEPTLRIYKREYNGNNVKKSAVEWYSAMRTRLSFKDLKFQMEFRYTSPEISAQSKTKESYYANAAMKLLFFDRHLTVTLRASDIFNTLNQDKDVYGIGFQITKFHRETTQIFSLGISYYFQSKAEDEIEEIAEEDYDDF